MSERDPLDANQAARGSGASAGGPPTAAIVISVVALAILAVVAFVFLRPDDSDPPVGAASATPSASATPTASPSATAEPSPTAEATAAREWELARIVKRSDDPSTAAVFFGVQWHEGPGWIAHGLQENTEDGRPGVWTSGDGRSWALADLPSGLEGSPVVDIARGEVDGSSRFVALLAGFTGQSRIVTSDDGSSWELATTPETGTLLHAVAHGPAGFVATGTVGDAGEPASGRIWQSSDGTAWEESAPPALERAQAYDIAILGERYVAAGFPNGPGPPLVAWGSTDATDWSEHEVSPPSDTGCLCVAADATAGRMVVLGLSRDAYAALSEDGESWTAEVLEADSAVTLSGADVVDDGAIVATGSLNIADGPRDALIWVRDADATEWRAVDWRAELPEVRDEEIGLGGSVHVAVGPERTLILISDGAVFLTSDRLP